MTDQAIQAWLAKYENVHAQEIGLRVGTVRPLLKELLAYRAFKLFPCWRVWAPDKSEQGWKLLATFPTKESARDYRQLIFRGDCLVLEGHEEPALTAR